MSEPTPPALPGEAVKAAHRRFLLAIGIDPDDPSLSKAVPPYLSAITAALEAARPHLAAAVRATLASGAACITPCDDDCELQPDGCHEEHTPDFGQKRGHQPWTCQDIRAAIAAAAAAERERIKDAGAVSACCGAGYHREPGKYGRWQCHACNGQCDLIGMIG